MLQERDNTFRNIAEKKREEGLTSEEKRAVQAAAAQAQSQLKPSIGEKRRNRWDQSGKQEG